MRILVLSEIGDWDLGSRLKASGHDIVAWVPPTWEGSRKNGGPYQTIRATLRTIFSQPKPIRAIDHQFNVWAWLDKEKIPRTPCFNVNTPTFAEYAKNLNLDLIVVYFFPQILKAPILQTPRLGVINCHPSLLPRYAGPQPGFWMIKNGESVAGITVHVMTEKIDAGDIIARHELILGANENIGQLMQRQHHAAATLLTEAVNAMARGAIAVNPQNTEERSYFGKKKAADAFPDWNGSAKQILDLLHALQPYEPLAARLNGRTIKIYDAQPHAGGASRGVPGQIMAKRSGTLLVQTGNGCLEIRSYEIAPFHGWVNRVLQEILIPPIGSRFDLTPPAPWLTLKAVP
jgi:methionyl-tRNA formyltransferase